jgi:hypothetical protein
MAAFLGRLLLRWRSWRGRTEPRESAETELGGAEVACRFIHDPKKVSRKDRRALPRAFAPDRRGELSAAHTTGLKDAEVWALGRKTLSDLAGRRELHARADLAVAALISEALRAVRDDVGFERHVTVRGWPAPAADEGKERLKEITLALSQASQLYVCDPPLRLDLPSHA